MEESQTAKIASLEAKLRELEVAGIDQAVLEPFVNELADLKAGLELERREPQAQQQYVGEARLPTDFTEAVPDAGQARLPLSPEKPDPRAKIPGAKELPPCTVVVVGANGRVGSKVCTELLRKHSKVNVRALVRSARCARTRARARGAPMPPTHAPLLEPPAEG